jgi:hypothetical protein
VINGRDLFKEMKKPPISGGFLLSAVHPVHPVYPGAAALVFSISKKCARVFFEKKIKKNDA